MLTIRLSRVFVHLFLGAIIALPVLAQDADRRLLIERSKKEGELIWYTTAGLQDSKPMADEFQKDYPFIKPSVVRRAPACWSTESSMKREHRKCFSISSIPTMKASCP